GDPEAELSQGSRGAVSRLVRQVPEARARADGGRAALSAAARRLRGRKGAVDSELQHHADLDRRLVEAAKPIKILSHLAWPPRAYHEFVAAWKAGRPALPTVEIPRLDFSQSARELGAIAEACDASHPIGRYVRDTAASYVTAARTLESAGTHDFTRLSGELFGWPGDRLGASDLTNLDAARHFIHSSQDLTAHCPRSDE